MRSSFLFFCSGFNTKPEFCFLVHGEFSRRVARPPHEGFALAKPQRLERCGFAPEPHGSGAAGGQDKQPQLISQASELQTHKTLQPIILTPQKNHLSSLQLIINPHLQKQPTIVEFYRKQPILLTSIPFFHNMYKRRCLYGC